MKKDAVLMLLESLTGERAPFADQAPEDLAIFEAEDQGLGYSQLNELLLLFGFDRVNYAFFCFLVGAGPEDENPSLESEERFRTAVDRFRELAILVHGNVKFAFKVLSQSEVELEKTVLGLVPTPVAEFASRCEPILPIVPIPPDEAYLTGYLIGVELSDRLKRDPDDAEAIELTEKRIAVLEAAKRNHVAYLASDHLDVYVATSMRERSEFAAISKLTREIFEHPEIAHLNLRWFDPTQAYCPNRVDKGLAEALMLRRAACTIYLIQETDTLGKDSELASTLAQGKPVVAYIPMVTDEYVDAHLRNLEESYPKQTAQERLLAQLQVFDPGGAWTDPEVRSWCEDPNGTDVQALRDRLQDKMGQHYDRRAQTLGETHPLGIQVNLNTGVANGVLVVRTVQDCAKLVKCILTRSLHFEFDEHPDYVALRESISGCVFRVVTRDRMLTNSFWNYYIN